jgi:hypothetical protein
LSALQAKDGYNRLRTARRFFGLIPVFTFVLMLVLLATGGAGEAGVAQVILRALVVALVTALVCVGAYGFYRYLQERSPGL